MEVPTEGLGPRSDDPAFQSRPAGSPDGRVGHTAGGMATEIEPDAAAEPGGPGGPGEPGGERPATGEPRVDAALGRLDELAGRPVTEHRAIFEDVHRRLRDVLGELDTHDPSQAQDARGAERRAGR
jgi:hypothetical protein